MTSADTAAIIGSMDSVAYTYMRTGRVWVAGEVTKIDSVTSSKLLMNASSQPPATPGRIIGRVIWRNSVKRLAPSDSRGLLGAAIDPDGRRPLPDAARTA
jgi:hypothetical protein